MRRSTAAAILMRKEVEYLGGYLSHRLRSYSSLEELLQDVRRVLAEAQSGSCKRVIPPSEADAWVRKVAEKGWPHGVDLIACGGGVSENYPGSARTTLFGLRAARGYKGIYASVQAERVRAPRVYWTKPFWIKKTWDPLKVLMPMPISDEILDVAWFQLVEYWWYAFEREVGIPKQVMREMGRELPAESVRSILNEAFRNKVPAPRRLARFLRELIRSGDLTTRSATIVL